MPREPRGEPEIPINSHGLRLVAQNLLEQEILDLLTCFRGEYVTATRLARYAEVLDGYLAAEVHEAGLRWCRLPRDKGPSPGELLELVQAVRREQPTPHDGPSEEELRRRRATPEELAEIFREVQFRQPHSAFVQELLNYRRAYLRQWREEEAGKGSSSTRLQGDDADD
jgi:hypothetical protein